MNTGTRTQVPETRSSGMPRILRLSLRSFCSSSVSPLPSSTTEPAIGSTLNAIGRTYLLRGRQLDGGAVVGEQRSTVAHRGDLAGELVDAGEPAAGDRLVRAGHQPDQAGLVVQRLEHRHRGHRGAVRVGDDALAGLAYGVRVDLAHDEGDVGVHPPGRGVVHHDGAGRGEDRGQPLRRRAAGREQGDVQAARVGGLGVLDGDLTVAPDDRRAGGACGGEEPDLLDGEVPLEQDPAHHGADLAGGADDPDADPARHRPVPP